MKPLVSTTPDPQQDLLRTYCSQAEELLKTATSAEQAREMSERICGQFQNECESSLVINATRAFVEDVIGKMFGARG
jgi:hypothetical protein